MKFEEKKIEDVFSVSKRYRVPKYQRGYAWKEKIQIQDLWDDLCEVSSDSPLYLGTVILQRSKEDSDVYEIVDGQQRITTLSILFIACRNHAIKNNFPQMKTLPYLIAGYDIASGGNPTPRLEPGVNISEAYKFLVENPDYEGESFPKGIDGRKSKILKSNYLFFYDRVTDMEREQLEEFVTNVLKNTFLLSVIVEEAAQAFDIFERTNARGAPLNISDLLKNMLFASETEIDNLTDRWDNIVIETDTKLPRLLKYFDTQVHGKETGKKVLFNHLRTTVRLQGPSSFMNEIEVFSKFYNQATSYSLENDKSSRISQHENYNFLYQDEIFFSRFQRSINALNLSRVQVPLPYIYAGLKALEKFSISEPTKIGDLKSKYIHVVNIIECFHFINNGICTVATNSSEALYATETEKLNKAESITECKESLNRVLEGLKKLKIADRGSFIKEFSQITYYVKTNKALIAYIFDCLHNPPFEKVPTLKLFDPRSETVFNRKYEVEHVASVSKWEGDEDVLNNIGNLLLVTHTLNRAVGNKEFTDKVSMYKEADYDNLVYVRDFVSWVENNKIKEFGTEEINKRAKELAAHAYDLVWNPWL